MKNKNKKRIFFDICGNDNWIGGVYYLKNILWSINLNENINEKYKMVILADKKYAELFEVFEKNMDIYYYNSKRKINRLFTLIKILLFKNIDYIYYYHDYKFDFFHQLRKKAIYWIPDFQELYYPEFFTNSQLSDRQERISNIIASDRPLVLSSQQCIDDMNKFYPNNNKTTYLVKFVSYIENDIQKLTDEFCVNTLEKYKLTKDNYFFVSNQFWQHKNHKVIFKMIKKYKDDKKIKKIFFVFTGSVKDYRNEMFYNELMEYINDSDIKDKIKILGFINRDDQLALMKNSKAVIQPSLFEGWGTVLEDAKVLDKLVILSDISIHREQKNENCIMFNPYDTTSLYLSLIKCLNIEHVDSIQKGISNMKKNAVEYSKELENMLDYLG